MIEKRQWWNSLIGNPGGYLPVGASVDSVAMDLPYREYLAVGPSWLRTWHAAFLGVLFTVSLAIQIGLHIV